MKKFYKLLLAISLLFGLNPLYASHISGMNFQYECVGQDSFLITLNLYRDCSGIAAPSFINVNIGSTCGSFSPLLSKVNGPNGSDVSQICPNYTNSCNGGSFAGIQKHVYQGIVELSFCTNWKLSLSLCERNTTVNIVGKPCTYIEADLYTGHGNSCNNSISFSSVPVPYVCLNEVFNYNLGVTNLYGDSLTYQFVSPLITYNTSVSFNSGYSFNQPIPGITLDTISGLMTFTPTILGNFALAVQVCQYEYGTGVFKGCITNDFEFVVIDCSNNFPPTTTSTFANVQGGGTLISSDSIRVCVGDTISFDVSFTDSNLTDTITLLSNINSVLPGASTTFVSGNPATLSVSWVAQQGPKYNPFYVTGMDNACPYPAFSMSTFMIIVDSSTFAGPDLTICQNSQWAQMGAYGGSSFIWTVLSGDPIDTVVTSPTYNATCMNCQFPSFSPSSTTIYMVTSVLSTNCVNTDTVVVNVVPDFDVLMPNDTLICSIDDYRLQISTDQPSFSYTYNWSPSNSLDFDTIMNPLATPYEPTNYSVTLSSSMGCKKTGAVFVDLSAPFPTNMQVLGDTILCFGESSDLSIDFGNSYGSNCGGTSQGCLGIVQDGYIGTGMTTNSGAYFPSIYGGSRWGAKHQIIYRPSDLISMGLAPGGMLNSIAFFVNTVSSQNVYENFEIKIGCTSQMDLSNGWITSGNMTIVVPSYTHTVNTGWNIHSFINSYKWDGISSLIVEVCFNNSQSVYQGNCLIPYTSTNYQSVVYQVANDSSVCQLYKSVGGFFGAATLTNQRPNTRFNFCVGFDTNSFTYSWLPTSNFTTPNSATSKVTPLTSQNYQVIVKDSGNYCTDTLDYHIDVVNQFDVSFTSNSPYCLNDGQDTLLPNIGGGYFLGLGVDSNGIFYPDSAGVGSKQITYRIDDPVLCADDTTINVTVVSLPDASFDYEEICVGSGPVVLNAVNSGGLWTGIGISDTLNGIFDPIGLSAGLYPIVHFIDSNCVNSDTISIKVVTPYTFTLNQNPISVCQNEIVQLVPNYTLSNNPLQGSGPVKESWSDVNGFIDSNGVFDARMLYSGNVYPVLLTVEDSLGGCGSSQNVYVSIDTVYLPVVLMDLSYCIGHSNVLIDINPNLFDNQISFNQKPLPPLNLNDTLMISSMNNKGMFNPLVRGLGSWEITINRVNLNGCIGTIVDTIHVLSPPTNDTVNQSGSVLMADLSGGYTYQWLDCDNNMQPIQGATGQSFIPSVTGNYAVKISAGECSITSSCYESWPLGLEENSIETGLKLYPNPTNDVLYINKGLNDELNIEILDYTGKTIYYSNTMDQITEFKMQDLASGMYFIKLSNEKGSYVEKVVKK
ncbi:T9SS type A sorting domain-containing protein [bacterium SCSIO 12643]|nr:T9SS type A sorting domain-containing protein [bacterium SCSIO 12643]